MLSGICLHQLSTTLRTRLLIQALKHLPHLSAQVTHSGGAILLTSLLDEVINDDLPTVVVSIGCSMNLIPCSQLGQHFPRRNMTLINKNFELGDFDANLTAINRVPSNWASVPTTSTPLKELGQQEPR